MSNLTIHARLAKAIKIQQDKILKTIREKPLPINKIFRYHGLESNRTCSVLYITDSSNCGSNLPFSISLVGPHVSINRHLEDDMIKTLIKNSIVCREKLDDELFIVIRLHGEEDVYQYKCTNGAVREILRCTLRRLIIEIVTELGFKKVHVLDNSCEGEPNTLDAEEFIDRYIPSREVQPLNLECTQEENFIVWHSIVDDKTLNCAEYIYGTHFLSPLTCILQDYCHADKKFDFMKYIQSIQFERSFYTQSYLDTTPMLNLNTDDPANTIEISKNTSSTTSVHSDFAIIQDDTLSEIDDLHERYTCTIHAYNKFVYRDVPSNDDYADYATGNMPLQEGDERVCGCGNHRFMSKI